MAHFNEHLLFQGSIKYPKEDEYEDVRQLECGPICFLTGPWQFLSQHNGLANAETDLDMTTFWLSVSPDAFEGAIDRFSAFFYGPLFNEGSVEREVRAIDHEWSELLQSDCQRFTSLQKSLSNPQHPFSRFGIGNLESLWTLPKAEGRNVRDALIQFHKENYSANLMKRAYCPFVDLLAWLIDLL